MGSNQVSLTWPGSHASFSLIKLKCQSFFCSVATPMTHYMPPLQKGILHNINLQAVKLGYGVAEDLPLPQRKSSDDRLARKIMKAQKYAANKKLGAWKEWWMIVLQFFFMYASTEGRFGTWRISSLGKQELRSCRDICLWSCWAIASTFNSACEQSVAFCGRCAQSAIALLKKFDTEFSKGQ